MQNFLPDRSPQALSIHAAAALAIEHEQNKVFLMPITLAVAITKTISIAAGRDDIALNHPEQESKQNARSEETRVRLQKLILLIRKAQEPIRHNIPQLHQAS